MKWRACLRFWSRRRRCVAFSLLPLLCGSPAAAQKSAKDSAATAQGAAAAPEGKQMAAAAAEVVKLTIRSVDAVAVRPGSTAQVAQTAIIEGTVTRGDVVVCVLVHPLVMKIWWVQPPAVLLREGSVWRWQARSWFGADQIGKGDSFEVVAVAERTAKVCRSLNRIEGERFPQELPHSQVLPARRSKG